MLRLLYQRQALGCRLSMPAVRGFSSELPDTQDLMTLLKNPPRDEKAKVGWKKGRKKRGGRSPESILLDAVSAAEEGQETPQLSKRFFIVEESQMQLPQVRPGLTRNPFGYKKAENDRTRTGAVLYLPAKNSKEYSQVMQILKDEGYEGWVDEDMEVLSRRFAIPRRPGPLLPKKKVVNTQ